MTLVHPLVAIVHHNKPHAVGSAKVSFLYARAPRITIEFDGGAGVARWQADYSGKSGRWRIGDDVLKASEVSARTGLSVDYLEALVLSMRAYRERAIQAEETEADRRMALCEALRDARKRCACKRSKYAGAPKAIADIPDLLKLDTRQVGFIYFLCSKGEVIYIGQTRSISTRMSAHRRDKEFDDIYFFRVLDLSQINQIELDLIEYHKPRLNVAGTDRLVATPLQIETRRQNAFKPGLDGRRNYANS